MLPVGASVACVVAVDVARIVVKVTTHQADSLTMIDIASSAASDLTVNETYLSLYQAFTLLSHFVDLLL